MRESENREKLFANDGTEQTFVVHHNDQWQHCCLYDEGERILEWIQCSRRLVAFWAVYYP